MQTVVIEGNVAKLASRLWEAIASLEDEQADVRAR
jgi:hypothetical protein